VLQRYRGELTLLDGRGQGGGAGDSDEGGSIGYGGRQGGYSGGGGSYGGSSGGSSGGGRAPAPAGGGRLGGDLDDDIPF